jgi:hypothetical protein
MKTNIPSLKQLLLDSLKALQRSAEANDEWVQFGAEKLNRQEMAQKLMGRKCIYCGGKVLSGYCEDCGRYQG